MPTLPTAMCDGDDLDLVIRGGRVIDPETGLDDVRQIGVKRGRIVALCEDELSAPRTLDARGLIVSPGFIDLHTHTPTVLGERFQARDGVTTALDLEGGAFPVGNYGSRVENTPLINYGSSVSYTAIRISVVEMQYVPTVIELGLRGGMDTAAFTQRASPLELVEMQTRLESSLEDGAIGIGLLLDYMSSAVDAQELRMIGAVAGAYEVPIFVHVRRGPAGDPGGLEEVLQLARETGASIHVCHINASAMGSVIDWLERIVNECTAGMDITTEMFPYTAGSTSISAAVFRRDWQRIFGIDYSDIQWMATGEWLTEEKWNQHLRDDPAGNVVHHYMRESWLRQTLEYPDVMVATDAMPVMAFDTLTVPNGMGTFSRLLGRYVRETSLLDWSTAIRKVTLLPALRLERVASGFRYKGRVQVGADADLTIFSPKFVMDRATYGEPLRPPEGIDHVIVGGIPIVEHGLIVPGVSPGRHLFNSI